MGGMKYLDKVKVLNDYGESNIFKGEVGTIFDAEIRDGCFHVIFNTNHKNDWYKYGVIKIEDLLVVEESSTTDEQILEELPLNNPKWWCKVEGGYILNLLGEKKNKIPYDYNS